MNKLVSIIVPVYNCSKFLGRCIDSLVAQRYKEVEIILFDDGSKDGSLTICRKYAEKDGRIKVFSRENRGVSQTRLDAFHHSTGEYVTFVDADDYVSEDYVAFMVEHLERENVDVVSSQHCNVIEGKTTKVIRKVNGRMDRKAIDGLLSTKYLYDDAAQVSGITVYLCTKLIKREFVEKTLQAGLHLWYGEDQAGVTQLLYDISSIFVSDDYTYYYIIHSSQVTGSLREDFWKAQCMCWQRMKDIDTRQLLSTQLSLRMMLNINAFLHKVFNLNGDYQMFKQEIKEVRAAKVTESLFKRRSVPLKANIRLLFLLLKYRQYRLTYLLFKSIKLIKSK